MRPGLLVTAGLAIALVVVLMDRVSAQAVRSGTSKATVDLLRETEMGNECVIEMDGEGGVITVEASVPLTVVPQVCRDAADTRVPNGKSIGAEKEWAGGKVYWEVVKDLDGMRYEILMNPDGSIAGEEVAFGTGVFPPAAVVEAAKKAAGGGEMVVCEEVNGPEAAYGEDYHVKLRVKGEVVRVSVKKDGTVVRTTRKIKAEVRVPK